MGKSSIPRLSLRLTGRLLAGVIGLAAVLLVPAMAGASSQGFNVLHGQPQTGMLMSLTANPGVIEPASDKNAKSLVGVVAPATETNLDQQAGQINVKTDGAASGLVSTLGGDVRVGDRITTSPLEGVGTKTNASGWIVGVAQASLDAHTSGAFTTTVTDTQGVKRTVYVASIPLLVKVTYYTVPDSSADKSSDVPAIVQQAADAIAGKHVSTKALVLSFLLFVIGIIAAGSLVNSAIRGGFSAIARQPLAKFVILREVWKSFGLALLILTFALIVAMLMLRIL